jgi:hypothetical protein
MLATRSAGERSLHRRWCRLQDGIPRRSCVGT